MYIAWDLETCPLPEERFSDRERKRLELEMRWHGQRTPDLEPAELRRKAASLHPLLGWIVCISVIRAPEDPEFPNEPRSYVAARPEEERAMLEAFWADLARFPADRPILWITFNGKRFDVPFLLARTLHYGLAPTRLDVLQTHRWRNRPHCDLWTLFADASMNMALEDLCTLLQVPNPKLHGQGFLIEELLRTEGIEGVRRYCEADAAATLACFARIRRLYPALVEGGDFL